jgi:hypothetical protein
MYIGSATTVDQIAIEGFYLYWANGSGGVSRTGLDGNFGVTKTYITAMSLAVSTGDIYIGTLSSDPMYPNHVMKIPADGSKEVSIAGSQVGASNLFLSGVSVYWSSPSAGTIMKATTTGTTLTTVASGLSGPVAMAAAAGVLYFADVDPVSGMGAIKQVSMNNDNATAPSVLATGRPNPSSIATDGSYVYWIEQTPNGGVYKVAITGGTVTPLAQNQVFANGLALDGTTLWWGTKTTLGKVSTAGGTVVTWPKPTGTPSSLVVDTTAIYVPMGGLGYRFGKF